MNRFFTMLKISRGIPIWLVQLLFQCLMKMSCWIWMLFHSAMPLEMSWGSPEFHYDKRCLWPRGMPEPANDSFVQRSTETVRCWTHLGPGCCLQMRPPKKVIDFLRRFTIPKFWVLQTGAFFSYVLSKHQDRDASGTVLWSLQRGWCMAQLCHVWFWLGACFTCKDPQCLNFKPLDIKTSPGGSYCHHGAGSGCHSCNPCGFGDS